MNIVDDYLQFSSEFVEETAISVLNVPLEVSLGKLLFDKKRTYQKALDISNDLGNAALMGGEIHEQ